MRTTTDGKKLQALGDRIEVLVGELGSCADPRVREKAEELVRSLMEFYGAGLARILQVIAENPPEAERLFEGFAKDDLVAGLLVLHGLHPLAIESRVGRALERVHPYLGSHGGGVTLLGIEDGVVRLRLEGSCDGCPSSALTMKLAVERAIEEAAPEITRIEVESAAGPRPGSALPAAFPEPTRPPGKDGQEWAAEWVSLFSLTGIAPGEIAARDVGGRKIIVCKLGETLYSYGNRCPSCGAGLSEGSLNGEILTCRLCGHGYNVRLAGRSNDTSGFHLEPLPLLAERDAVRIAVPTSNS